MSTISRVLGVDVFLFRLDEQIHAKLLMQCLTHCELSKTMLAVIVLVIQILS